MAAENIDNTVNGTGLFPAKVPGLSDAADIQAALRLYHYGSYTYDGSNTNTSNLVNPSIAKHLQNLVDADTAHNSDTTNVHGIGNTADLATQAYVDTAVTNAITGAADGYPTLAGNAIDWNAVDERFDVEPRIANTGTVITKTENFTLSPSDVGKTIIVYSSSPRIVTLPANSSVEIPVGYSVDIIQTGSGSVTVSEESVAVSVNSKSNIKSLDGQYSKGTLVKIADNTWFFFGNLLNSVTPTDPTPVTPVPTPVAPTPTAPTPTAPTPTAPTPTAPTPTAPTPTAPECDYVDAPTYCLNVDSNGFGDGYQQSWTPGCPDMSLGRTFCGVPAPTPTAPTPTAPTPTAPTPTAPTPTAPTPTSTLVTYYRATSVCDTNSSSHIYYQSPSVTGPFEAESIPSDTYGGTGIVSLTVYRSTSAAALTAAIQSNCEPVTPTPTAPTPTAPTPVALDCQACVGYGTGITANPTYEYSCSDGCGTYTVCHTAVGCANRNLTECPGCGASPTPTDPTPTPTSPTPTDPTPTPGGCVPGELCQAIWVGDCIDYYIYDASCGCTYTSTLC